MVEISMKRVEINILSFLRVVGLKMVIVQ